MTKNLPKHPQYLEPNAVDRSINQIGHGCTMVPNDDGRGVVDGSLFLHALAVQVLQCNICYTRVSGLQVRHHSANVDKVAPLHVATADYNAMQLHRLVKPTTPYRHCTYEFVWPVNDDDADRVNGRSSFGIKAYALGHPVAPFCHHFFGRRAMLLPVRKQPCAMMRVVLQPTVRPPQFGASLAGW